MKSNLLFFWVAGTPFFGETVDDDSTWLLYLIGWAVSGGVGAMIGSKKGAGGMGFFLGLLLGPIGWLLVAVSKGNRINCPSCRELIDPQAKICPKCQTALVKGEVQSGAPMTQTVMAPARQAKSLDVTDSEPVIPPPPKRAENNLIQVARDGEDLGRMEPQKLCDLIAAGELTLQDHFFDRATNAWRTLNECPAIQIGEPQA